MERNVDRKNWASGRFRKNRFWLYIGSVKLCSRRKTKRTERTVIISRRKPTKKKTVSRTNHKHSNKRNSVTTNQKHNHFNFVHQVEAESSKKFTVAASKRAEGAKRGHQNSALSSANTSRQGSIDGGNMQRCGLCTLFSRLVRRAMCVGSRRGSGESYYQELADTTVSNSNTHHVPCIPFYFLIKNLQLRIVPPKMEGILFY